MERGHARPVDGFGWADLNWELRWPQSAKVYRRMLREDAQVKSVMKAVSLPIRRATWRVHPGDAPIEHAKMVAEDLRLPLLGEDEHTVYGSPRRVSWRDHMYWAMQSLAYGSMFFEIVYDDSSGRDRLRKLAPRLPSTLTRINVADDGGLASIEQTPRPGSSKQVVIPVDRLVAYVHDPEEMDWRGTSMLRAAYKHWLLKDQFLRLEGQVLDRNGMGVPVYTAGEPGNQEEIDRGQKMASELRSGSSSGASIPNEAKLEILGVKGQLVSPREAIAYHDAQIGRSALAHFLNLSDKGGSYALADTQAEIFVQALQTIAEDIADTANQHLVEEMVQVAFDSPGPYPRIVFDPIGTKKELTAEALSILINAGLILPDKDLEEEMRRRYGLPPKRPLPGTSEEDGSA
ncbi:phage portal protein family protein [Hoyosella altamirensis]|uniref:phage portal protein family protein n=2 Tax=Hoyosella altamirensis TaxID=616997 RepID=UPI0007DB2EE2|nr:DUF935 family protein [Hoyosella altamirensis]